MSRMKIFAGICFLLLAALPAANAQGVTGQISGTVVDAAGAMVAGAPVELTHDLSQQVHRFVTDSNGAFIFTGLVPGSYSIHIAQPGFKAYDQKGIPVSTQERVDLHEIKLQIGEVTSTIEVAAAAVHVATDSSDRSIAIGLQQIVDTPTRGRNPSTYISSSPSSTSYTGSLA